MWTCGIDRCSPRARDSRPTGSSSWWRLEAACGRTSAYHHGAAADDCETNSARYPVDRRDRHQDHEDEEGDLVPVEHADLFGKVQPDAAGTDDADDRRRTRVRFKIVEHLACHHRKDLGDQSEAHRLKLRAAGGGDALDRLLVGGLDRLGEHFAESAAIRHGDGEDTGERPETD